jgi:hypothetical protein
VPQYVRLKRGTEGKVVSDSTSTQAVFRKEGLWWGCAGRQLEQTATHRLGIGIGEGGLMEKIRKISGWENVLVHH